ncbi:allophanate hydrolase subunit 1 [Nocardioides sp. CFH 31398]|uniref:5-oxoprolinase subunit B family protein n=1 Tax=Nocardioides sp. CFH 31398 TaxID=2919579 RepID=UPI001F053976|nr:allophanate hydrolase subunit 1 [Nocardioides sp. CFH 31398]MCH1866640.1 allophanate hydrolase subunit 1 [Nocardioides sp. CFH 31398]
MRWRPCGDAAALAEVEDLDTVLRLHAAVAAAREDGGLPGVVDVVPAARTLLLRCATGADLERAVDTVTALELPDAPPTSGEEVTVEVVYDGEDLGDVATHLGCDVEEVVRRHTATRWRVAFTGFAPGFGYLVPDTGRDAGHDAGHDGADDEPHPLEVPRRPESRTAVPAGAVGLAGEFSGVYPRSSPGGWQLIGSTATPTWDVDRDPPALLTPGARVRFVEVGA